MYNTKRGSFQDTNIHMASVKNKKASQEKYCNLVPQIKTLSATRHFKRRAEHQSSRERRSILWSPSNYKKLWNLQHTIPQTVAHTKTSGLECNQSPITNSCYHYVTGLLMSWDVLHVILSRVVLNLNCDTAVTEMVVWTSRIWKGIWAALHKGKASGLCNALKETGYAGCDTKQQITCSQPCALSG